MENMKSKIVLMLAMVFALCSLSFGQLITNGSFEGSGLTGAYNPIYSGTAIPGWTVGNLGFNDGVHGVDLITTYWTASNGQDSVDLSAFEAGSISQTFATVPGASYHITFDFSANPDSQFGITSYTMEVSVTGSAAQEYSYDTSIEGNTSNLPGPGNMKWKPQYFDFVATSTATTLTFTDTTVGAGWSGPAIDNVVGNATSGIICHHDKGKPGAKTLVVGLDAVAAHLRLHGDTLGPCVAGN